MNYFKTELNTQKTKHPDGAKTLVFFVCAQFKKEAAEMAVEELKRVDDHWEMYKNPIVTPTTKEDYDEYQANKASNESVVPTALFAEQYPELQEAILECLAHTKVETKPTAQECYDALLRNLETLGGHFDLPKLCTAIATLKNPNVLTHSTVGINFAQGFMGAEQSSPSQLAQENKDEYQLCIESSLIALDEQMTDEHLKEAALKLKGVIKEHTDHWLKEANAESVDVPETLAAIESIEWDSGSEAMKTFLNIRCVRALVRENVVYVYKTESIEKDNNEICTEAEQETTLASNDKPDIAVDSSNRVDDFGVNGKTVEEAIEQTAIVDTFSIELEQLNNEISQLKVGDVLIKDDLPNAIYHASIGYSSSNFKDELISSQYRHAKESGDIEQPNHDYFVFGNLVHTLILEPHTLEHNYVIEQPLPKGALSGADSMKAAIEEENQTREKLLSNDELKAVIDEHNKTLTPKLVTSGSVEELAFLYRAMPDEFQTLGEEKPTGAAYKRLIKVYNDQLPSPLKTTGGRDSLLSAIQTFNPDLVNAESKKKPTLPTSGTIADLTDRIKSFNPDAVFAHEINAEFEQKVKAGKIGVTQDQIKHATKMVESAKNDPTLRNWILATGEHVSCERSYFWRDAETGLLVKARTDKEIGSLVVDVKTISVPKDIKKRDLKAYLDREIERRGYHISAHHYLNGANADTFFWLFLNTLPGYEWGAIVQATDEVLELGYYECREAIASIAESVKKGSFNGPITYSSNNGSIMPIQAELSYIAEKRLEQYRENKE